MSVVISDELAKRVCACLYEFNCLETCEDVRKAVKSRDNFKPIILPGPNGVEALRDQFASDALRTGMLMMGNDATAMAFSTTEQLQKKVAEFCYGMADVMLAERDKKNGGRND
jgi:hypothetical protein